MSEEALLEKTVFSILTITPLIIKDNMCLSSVYVVMCILRDTTWQTSSGKDFVPPTAL